MEEKDGGTQCGIAGFTSAVHAIWNECRLLSVERYGTFPDDLLVLFCVCVLSVRSGL